MVSTAAAEAETSKLISFHRPKKDDETDVPYGSVDRTYSSQLSTGSDSHHTAAEEHVFLWGIKLPLSLRQIALTVSLYVNVAITIAKLVAYIQTFSLSVLAALLDSVLDTVSQLILNYTEQHSSMHRSSAHYPAGASRLEPIGVLTCAALMGMASFEVLKESCAALYLNRSVMSVHNSDNGDDNADALAELTQGINMSSFWNMLAIVGIKLLLLWLCQVANKRRSVTTTTAHSKAVVQLADPTLEALSQDHFNDALSNSVAATALLFALRQPSLWFLDPVGAILISLYIIYSWYMTGKEQIEHLTGKCAPDDLIQELTELASRFDDRLEVDVVRAYHFGPKFLVEIEVVMPKETLLFESHDVGMDLQYEIEAREEVERCFVHIDYQTRPYDEHVVSKVPELRERYRPKRQKSVQSL